MVHFHAPIAKIKKRTNLQSSSSGIDFYFLHFSEFFYKTLEFTLDFRRLYCKHRLLKSLETVLKQNYLFNDSKNDFIPTR